MRLNSIAHLLSFTRFSTKPALSSSPDVLMSTLRGISAKDGVGGGDVVDHSGDQPPYLIIFDFISFGSRFDNVPNEDWLAQLEDDCKYRDCHVVFCPSCFSKIWVLLAFLDSKSLLPECSIVGSKSNQKCHNPSLSSIFFPVALGNQ